jgi:hypothetical protein
MTSLNTKLVLSALGVALLATPAFAQKPVHQTRQDQYQTQEYVPHTPYPNGSLRSGSEESVQDGAEFNGGY